MVFSSLLFLYRFLPAALSAYYLAPRPLRNFVLFLFSLLFYAWGEPVYVLLMLASIFFAWTGGFFVDHFQRTGRRGPAKAALMVSSLIGLSLLAFFKYADFAVRTVNGLLGTAFSLPHVSLPIGISFYTFQTMSYVIDVFRGEANVQRNFISFGTYVSMFPQLIAGPVVRYKTVDAQLRSRHETIEEFARGTGRFMIGLGKKVLLANNIGLLWDAVKVMPYPPALTAWVGLAAFTFQIYFDFSGYSDMAIGLGHMFGFQFPENFNYPYISKSITEFWRRWHISLGVWFREYVYIPLGGNRAGQLRQIRNILIVWLLTGFWHGASWNFAAWGLYYALLLLLEKFVLRKYLERLPSVLQHLYCIFFFMLGWALFAFDNLGQGIKFVGLLFGFHSRELLNGETLYLLCNHGVLLLFCALGSTELPRQAGERICEGLADHGIVLAIVQNVFYGGLLLLSTAWLVDASFNPFLYFRF